VHDRAMPLRLCSTGFLLLIIAAWSLAWRPASPAADAPGPRLVAFTVDDLPGALPGSDRSTGDVKDLDRINRAITSALRAHHVPAIGFANEKKLQVTGERDARVAMLQCWLDAGLTLGNHTYSHPFFPAISVQQMEDETIRGEVVTRTLMAASGQTLRYFRHPFLSTGATLEAKSEFESFLRLHGYRVAPVTIDNSDWMFNDVYVQALNDRDDKLASKTKDAFFEYEDTNWAYFEGVAQKLFGRNIAQIYLMHDNAINAEFLDSFLSHLEQRGYRFISLDEALRDPAYSTPDKFIGTQGISWLTRWKLAFGQRANYEDDPDPPKWVIEMSTKMRKAHGE
jgi:peptidoglycan-N-acetylglucosamine deacetylase